MIRRREPWRDYVTYDDNGVIDGLRDDAPDWAKEAYAEYLRQTRQTTESGARIKI